MRFAALAIISATVKRAAGHSWMTGAGGGIQRGGIGKSDSQNQRYFCPTADLEACQPDRNQGVKLTADAQRPCRPGRSAELGTGVAGEKLLVKWASNGHNNEQSEGTCVTVRYAKYKSNPSNSDFKTLASCLPYHHDGGKTNGEVTLPSFLEEGDYTIQWYWDFASFWYSSCTDIQVTSKSAGPKTISAVAQVAAADFEVPAEETDAVEEVEEEKDEAVADAALDANVSKREYQKYVTQGCSAMDDPKQFCKRLIKGKSYCKDFLKDQCGRSLCHRDNETELSECRRKVLLL